MNGNKRVKVLLKVIQRIYDKNPRKKIEEVRDALIFSTKESFEESL